MGSNSRLEKFFDRCHWNSTLNSGNVNICTNIVLFVTLTHNIHILYYDTPAI